MPTFQVKHDVVVIIIDGYDYVNSTSDVSLAAITLARHLRYCIVAAQHTAEPHSLLCRPRHRLNLAVWAPQMACKCCMWSSSSERAKRPTYIEYVHTYTFIFLHTFLSAPRLTSRSLPLVRRLVGRFISKFRFSHN